MVLRSVYRQRNCFIHNTINFNTNSGISNSGTNNSFFGNKSQQNGPSVTDNFSGVPLDIIATFELASGNFFSTPTICCNVNVSVIP